MKLGGQNYSQWRKWEDDLVNGVYDQQPEMESPKPEETMAEAFNQDAAVAPKRSKLQMERWEPRRQETLRAKKHQQQLFKSKERKNTMEAAWGDVPETEENWQEEIARKYALEETENKNNIEDLSR